jgi:hypothetical protein
MLVVIVVFFDLASPFIVGRCRRCRIRYADRGK